MKKVLLIVILMSSIKCYAQGYDSLPKSPQQLTDAVLYMRDNFKKCHNEFSTGLDITIFGSVVTIGGFIATDYSVKRAIFITGSLLSIVGGIVMIDSHKYIGRAGRWHFEGNRITVDF